MEIKLETVSPQEIERRSFEIITAELGDHPIDPANAMVVKRVIHTTADFSFADTLCFSPDAVAKAVEAIRRGASIVTDTQMARAGVSQSTLKPFGGEVHCFIAEPEVAAVAKRENCTRARASMDRAAKLDGPLIFAIGNAPTALVRLYELIRDGEIKPSLVIGVPVGFVNVVESKELILQAGIPYIVARGRRGGSNVAAAVCNALLYEADGRYH